MAEARNYIWIIPLIAGILAIGILFAPATSMNFMGYVRDYLWLWGFYILDAPVVPETAAHFIPSVMIMITSIVVTALIALSGILLIVFAAKAKKRSELRGVRNVSIVAGILLIFSEILWLVLIPLFFPFSNYTFWATYPGDYWRYCYMAICFTMHNAGFGVIGGFIAAGLTFLGVGLASYYSKERPEKVPKTIKPVVPSEEKGPVTKTELLFCSECGAKIEDPNLKFCGNCGHEY